MRLVAADVEPHCADFWCLKILSLWRGNKDNSEGLLLKHYPIISWLHLHTQLCASLGSHQVVALVLWLTHHCSFHKATKAIYLLAAGTESKHCSCCVCSCTFMCTSSSFHSIHSNTVYNFCTWVFSLSSKEKTHHPMPLTMLGFSMMLVHGPSTML